jgi:hypothetical protein
MEKQTREQDEGCEFCGLKENCNNYKLGIKEGRTQAISKFKKKLKVKFDYWRSLDEAGLKPKYEIFSDYLEKTAQEMKA